MVDYSLVVDVAMDGLPTRLNRALFAAVSGTTWVRPLLESAAVVFFCISSSMGPKMNARHLGALGNTLGETQVRESPRLTSAHLCGTRRG